MYKIPLIFIFLLLGIVRCFSQTDSLSRDLKQKNFTHLITAAPMPDSTISKEIKKQETYPSRKQFTGAMIGIILILTSSIFLFYSRTR